MTLTTKNITEAQIRTLRRKAVGDDDFELMVTCDIAVGQPFEADNYTALEADQAKRLKVLTREQAIASVVFVFNQTAVE